MITAWTKHLKNASDIDEFEQYIRSSRRLLDRLTEILREQNAYLDGTETSVKDYEDPSWAYKQAFRNGQRSTLKAILKLINLDHEAKNEFTSG
jgi:hypothetical protein